MSRFEVALRRIVEKAMGGDPRAFQMLLNIRAESEVPKTGGTYLLSPDDKHIIDSMAARMRRAAGGS